MYPKKVTSTIAREGGFLKPHHWFILSPKIDTSYDESMAVFLWTMINHPYCQSYITGVGRFHFIPYYYTTDRFVGLSLYHITNWGREKCHSPIFWPTNPQPIGFLGHWAQPNRTSGRQRGSTTTGPSRKPTAWRNQQGWSRNGVGINQVFGRIEFSSDVRLVG